MPSNIFVSTEFIAGVTGAVVGAAAAYGLGWWQRFSDNRQQRKSVAGALLVETYWISYALEQLRDHWTTKMAHAHLPTTVHDRFSEHLALFRPTTVYAVMDFVGTINDLKTGLKVNNDVRVTDPKKLQEEIRNLANVALLKAVSSRDCLVDEGAARPTGTPLPSDAEVTEFLQTIREPWQDQVPSGP